MRTSKQRRRRRDQRRVALAKDGRTSRARWRTQFFTLAEVVSAAFVVNRRNCVPYLLIAAVVQMHTLFLQKEFAIDRIFAVRER